MSSMTCRIRQRIGCWSGWGASRRLDGGPDVFRLSVRSLLAHKLRMAMSVFAVVLGTAFVSGALVFGSSLTTILDGAFTGSAVDLQVSPKPAVDANPFGPQSTVTLKDDALTKIR